MNMKSDIQKIVNDQINAELESAYAYLGMKAYFDEQSLEGLAHWAKKQLEEEQEHAMKFYRHLLERGGSIELKAIEAVGTSFNSPLDAFKKALEQEQYITKRIYDMYEKAVSEKDYPLQQLLNWFIEEQVEEEDMVQTIIDKLELAGDSGASILMLDRELGNR